MAASAPLPEAHSVSKEYRDRVVGMFGRAITDFPLITEDVPLVTPLFYHHLAIAVSDVPAAAAFYGKLGFSATEAVGAHPRILELRGAGGLILHLVRADEPLPEAGKNILMDYATVKHPGHTHASWSVPSVPAVKALLEAAGVPLSGTRSSLAVFVRDTDRTTLEFERNDGGDEPPAEVSPAMIGFKSAGEARTMDHVGIRVRAPLDRHVTWYAAKLGFHRLVNKYEANPDPLRNMPPWVTRSAAGADINLIINANTPAPAAEAGGEGAENVLLAGGRVRPGILYPAFAIAEGDAAAVAARLREGGVDAAVDADLLAGGAWGDFPAAALRALEGGPTVLVRDLNGSVIRLVPTAAAAVAAASS